MNITNNKITSLNSKLPLNSVRSAAIPIIVTQQDPQMIKDKQIAKLVNNAPEGKTDIVEYLYDKIIEKKSAKYWNFGDINYICDDFRKKNMVQNLTVFALKEGMNNEQGCALKAALYELKNPLSDEKIKELCKESDPNKVIFEVQKILLIDKIRARTNDIKSFVSGLLDGINSRNKNGYFDEETMEKLLNIKDKQVLVSCLADLAKQYK